METVATCAACLLFVSLSRATLCFVLAHCLHRKVSDSLLFPAWEGPGEMIRMSMCVCVCVCVCVCIIYIHPSASLEIRMLVGSPSVRSTICLLGGELGEFQHIYVFLQYIYIHVHATIHANTCLLPLELIVGGFYSEVALSSDSAANRC